MLLIRFFLLVPLVIRISINNENKVRGSHGCGLWKGIMLGWDSFNVHLRFKVGRGDRVRLWYDSWCGDVPLKDSYPVLFECTSNKAATIRDVLLRVQGRQDWNVTFTRNFNDWEMDLVVSFLNLLQSNIPAMEVEDGLWWKLKKTGRFNTRSYYEALRDPPQVDFPWKSIWRSKALRWASFFVWTAAWNKVWTCDNLRKRGHILPSWCCMCRCNGESADHLLIHCSAASVLWCWVFRAFGIQWVLPGGVADVLRCWWNGLGRHSSDVWNLELDGSIQNVEAKIHHTEATLKDLRKLQDQIATKTVERSTLFKEQQKRYAALAEENEDTDEELEGMENRAHMSLKNERDTTIQKVFARHNLGSLPNIPFSNEVSLSLINRIKSRLMDLEKDMQDKKISNENELKTAWDHYMEANDRWKNIEAQKQAKLEIKHLTEALGPLSKEKDKLLNDYNELKAKLNHEYEEQADQKRNYQQEVESLLKINSKIKEYYDLKKGDRLKELQEKKSVLESQLQSCDIRKQEISDELNKSKDLMRNQDQLRRNIEDNLNYREKKAEVDELAREIESLEEGILKIGGVSTFEAELGKLAQERERLLSEVNRCHGTMSVYQSNISKNKIDLKQAQYKDIDKRYFDQLIQLKTTEMANKDLDRYYNALDK
uniref:Reverse transcriptase zinc-binding domain-containing protein n=1 Tax=Fagus sylvatica TaxID=28930 RepID=A0A2N9EHM7_FAGSY